MKTANDAFVRFYRLYRHGKQTKLPLAYPTFWSSPYNQSAVPYESKLAFEQTVHWTDGRPRNRSSIVRAWRLAGRNTKAAVDLLGIFILVVDLLKGRTYNQQNSFVPMLCSELHVFMFWTAASLDLPPNIRQAEETMFVNTGTSSKISSDSQINK